MSDYSVPVRIGTEHHGWTLRLPPHRAVRWLREPLYERERINSMAQHIRDGDRIFDIGAEEGDMTALWRLLDPSGQIIAVEPNPKVWPCIRACFEANEFDPIDGYFVGFASDEDTVPPQCDADDVDIAGWPHCAHGDLIPEHGFRSLRDGTSITQQTTIDLLTENYGPPDVITMDVEGGELKALQGAWATLKVHRPLVWVSVHPAFLRQFDATTGDVYRFLESCDYRLWNLGADHEVHLFAEPR